MIRRIFARGRTAEVKPGSNAPLNAVEVRPDEDSSTLVDGPSDDWIHEFDATIPPSPAVERSPDQQPDIGLRPTGGGQFGAPPAATGPSFEEIASQVGRRTPKAD